MWISISEELMVYMKWGPIFWVLIIFSLTGHLSQAGDKTPQDFVNEAKAEVKAVSVRDVKQMINRGEKIILLDVRDKEEYEKEHIPGAIHISRGQLEFLVEDKIPGKDAIVVVY